MLFRSLIGLMQPDAGDVRIGGTSLVGLGERSLIEVRKRCGLVFQMAALFDSMTIADNVAFPLRRARKMSEDEIAKRVESSLAMVDLPGIGHLKPAELSGGMRKRVGLARAIVYRPEIVFYDEPTTGLDPVASDSIDKLIARVCEIGRAHV